MIRPTRRTTATAVAAALALAATLGACGDDGDDAATTDATETTAASDPTGEQTGDRPVITDAWARTSPSMATAGAVYMVIENPTDTDDALVSASVDPGVATTVELHESRMEDDDADDGMDDDGMDDDDADDGMDDDGMEGDDDGGGMMTMTPVDRIPVPAGGTATLEPGGFHIMLLELAQPLEVGTTIEVTLTFEAAGEMTVSVDVRDSAP